MGRIIILPETTKNPITLIGMRAGICTDADITKDELNYKRGIGCIKANHGRSFEYVNVEIVLEGYSAKVIREWYTHIGGSPTRFQESTRYVKYDNFQYVTPPSIINNSDACIIYSVLMREIIHSIELMKNLGVPNEDANMVLPLCMATKVVDKRNLRSYIDMSRQRMCSRAYHEYRQLFNDICDALKNYSEEWAYIIKTQMKPKCEDIGYCPEIKSCGRKPKKDNNTAKGEDNR